jgi:hypothetical protein
MKSHIPGAEDELVLSPEEEEAALEGLAALKEGRSLPDDAAFDQIWQRVDGCFNAQKKGA